jgi:uncharacterized FlaG/YvyC family protein
MNSRKISNTLATVALLCAAASAPAAPGARAGQGEETENLAKDIDNILDRLEQHLQDEEADVLGGQGGQGGAPSQKIRGKEQKIHAKDEKAEKLSKLATAVSELEDQIEKLATDVQLSKQKALQNAKVDNYVEIEAALADPQQLGVRTLAVTIDNYEVYGLNEATGLWVPTNQLPIFAGPMQPGKHEVKVTARLVLRDSNNMPLNKSVQKNIDQSFTIEVPNGSTEKKRWVIKLAPPTAKAGQPQVDLTPT